MTSKKVAKKKTVPARGPRRAAPKKKPLRLEVGKWYKSRSGDIVGPMKRVDSAGWVWLFHADNSGVTYRPNGTQACGQREKSPHDLVREVRAKRK
jgi:hypothetical protein